MLEAAVQTDPPALVGKASEKNEKNPLVFAL